jgi:hypothetical protein
VSEYDDSQVEEGRMAKSETPAANGPPPPTGALVVIATLLTFIAADLALAKEITVWDFTQTAFAVGALLMGVRLVVQMGCWLFRGYFRRGHKLRRVLLRRFTVGRLVSMFVISAVCFRASTEPLLVVASTILLGVLTRCSVVFEGNIRPLLRAEKANSRASDSARRLPLMLLDEGKDGRCYLRVRFPFRRAYSSLRLSPGTVRELQWLRSSTAARWLLYYLRAAQLLALIFVFCCFGTATGIVTNPTNKPSQKTVGLGIAEAARPAEPTARPSSAAPAVLAPRPTPASTSPAIPEEPIYTCRNETSQPDISPRAIRALDALYEEESHLTVAEEGCFHHITAHKYHQELYFTTTGASPRSQGPASYAIDSERYGPVIVKNDVAPLIEKVVREVGPVGGVGRYPHYVAGAGQFYLTRSPRGIYMFIRRTATDSYVRLVPTAARALIGAAKEQSSDGVWLWPSQPELRANGDEVFRVSSTDQRVQVNEPITVAKTGEATRGRYHYPATPVVELSLAEVEALAATA